MDLGNTIENLRRSNIASGFDFLQGRAGFDISDTPDRNIRRIPPMAAPSSSASEHDHRGGCRHHHRHDHRFHRRRRPAVAELADPQDRTVYVEIFRNIPPLLVIFFWYSGRAVGAARAARQLSSCPSAPILNSRGFYFPRAIWGEGSWLIVAWLVCRHRLAWFVARRAKARQMATGQQFPVFWTGLALIVGLPLLAFALSRLSADASIFRSSRPST